MSDNRAEDWSLSDLVRLHRIADTTLEEARRCDQAGAPHAALVSLVVSFDAALLAILVAYRIEHEGELPDAKWAREPSWLSLGELAKRAVQIGVLSTSDKGKLDGILTPVRDMLAHPGAYMRRLHSGPDLDLGDPIGLQAVADIVVGLVSAIKLPTMGHGCR